MTETCPFCAPAVDRIFYRDSLVMGLWDGFPVTEGHALLVPIRHVPTWFDATLEEKTALLKAIDVAKQAIESKGSIDGFNIGINCGEAAGQTVFHLHVHVIPRRRGDVADPRGGVRYVIPSKANYLRSDAAINDAPVLTSVEQVLTTGASDPLLPHLKEHLSKSRRVDIAVAFTFSRGLDLIQTYLKELLERGGTARILTGDYLEATDPDALVRLLDFEGHIEVRVYESASSSVASAFGNAFHPKAYLFEHLDGSGAAFIGSSNLSESALTSGVEWNYKVLDRHDREGFAAVRQAFAALFYCDRTRPLTSDWIDAYRCRREKARELQGAPPKDVLIEPPAAVPEPHLIQLEALNKLGITRAEGKRAGLVVLATGLGKTWLSAFDSKPFDRVLFIAHREEILTQALETFRVIRPKDPLGRFSGTEKDPNASVLFASIQTLSRIAHLRKFRPDQFDYIIVDEFHHAHAATYRKVIDYFRPTFLLGLTATPERSDGGDLLALCEDNLVYRCDVPKGIAAGLLCPFRYFGVPDTVDYRNIPWRSRKFDEESLTTAVATQARAKNILDQYRKRAGKRTLAFCVSQRHADFMRDFFNQNGVSARAVHSGATSDPRAGSLDALKDGRIDVMCAVDMFNEGVDLPELDTVMMLRPTESRIVWLQQFGRGLRKSAAQKKLTVIDYIGNHRSFLVKPQALFGLPSGDHEVLNLLARLERSEEALPEGCEVTYELEVKNMLRALLQRDASAIELLTRRYQDFCDLIGRRPMAAEMAREGYNLGIVKKIHGSWLGFVRSQGGLDTDGLAAYEALQGFLDALDDTEMSKSYKMVVLLAMLNRDALPGGLSLDDLTDEVVNLSRQHPRVGTDIGSDAGDRDEVRRLLLNNPIRAWREGRGTGGVAYFRFENERFESTFDVEGSVRSTAQELVRELVEWRLTDYFARASARNSDQEYRLKVIRSGENPILLLPDRAAKPDLPKGWTDVHADGRVLSANFVKIAINVVREPADERNVLPEILSGWFGADAGKPGTTHQVVLKQSQAGWSLAPAGIVAAGLPTLYKAYVRADIPPLFGLIYSSFYWQQGFIRQGDNTFLLVTLDKSAHEEAFRYQDHFVSPTEFQWQSQNRTTQSSKDGRSICDHVRMGIHVHLFVRSKGKMPDGRGAPFYYLGRVNFKSWQGEKPITVQWELQDSIPPLLWKELNVPGGVE